jgi:hypothetical protein
MLYFVHEVDFFGAPSIPTSSGSLCIEELEEKYVGLQHVIFKSTFPACSPQ